MRSPFIREAAVTTHLLRLSAKLGVSDRTAAVATAIATAIAAGLLESPRRGPGGSTRGPPAVRSQATQRMTLTSVLVAS